MRIIGLMAIVGTIVLGAWYFGYWGSGWTEKDVKKMAGVAQEKFAEMKANAGAVIDAATG